MLHARTYVSPSTFSNYSQVWNILALWSYTHTHMHTSSCTPTHTHIHTSMCTPTPSHTQTWPLMVATISTCRGIEIILEQCDATKHLLKPLSHRLGVFHIFGVFQERASLRTPWNQPILLCRPPYNRSYAHTHQLQHLIKSCPTDLKALMGTARKRGCSVLVQSYQCLALLSAFGWFPFSNSHTSKWCPYMLFNTSLIA